MLGSAFAKTLRDYRRSLLWWSLGTIGVVALTVSVWPTVRDSPEIGELAENYPDVLEAFVGGTGGLDLTTPEGYLGVELFSFMAPIVLLVFAIGAGANAIAGEEERKTIGLLLATPISRARLVSEKIGAMLTLGVFLGLVLWLSLIAVGAAVDLGIDAWHLGAASALTVLFALHFGTFALLVGAATGRRGLSIGLAAGAATLTYLVSALAALVDWLEPYQKFSPYWHYVEHEPLRNGLSADNVAVLAGAIIGMAVLALPAFDRRDIAA
jgi:ABC-2 type transport system permease protein